MNKNKTNLNRSAHKKLLKEQRLAKLEKQLKTNILKRKKAIKLSNGSINNFWKRKIIWIY